MDSRYRQEVAKFSKKDGILALLVFLGFTLYTTAFVAIRGMLSLPWFLSGLVSIVSSSFVAVIVIIIVLRKKQGLSSIGLHKEKIWPAIRLGLLICLIPVLFRAIIPGFLGGFNELQIGMLLLSLVLTFFSAAHEDIIFVGFIQTRLYGFFKTDRVAMTVGALFFALAHIPPWLVMGRFTTENILMWSQPFFGWIIMHLLYTSILKKYYSLVPIFIIHTISNFSWDFPQIPLPTVLGIDFSLISLSLYALTAVILLWHTHKQSKKAMKASY
jgi:membrane protease YdiL (CAAX protease family)